MSRLREIKGKKAINGLDDVGKVMKGGTVDCVVMTVAHDEFRGRRLGYGMVHGYG